MIHVDAVTALGATNKAAAAPGPARSLAVVVATVQHPLDTDTPQETLHVAAQAPAAVAVTNDAAVAARSSAAARGQRERIAPRQEMPRYMLSVKMMMPELLG